MKISLNTMKQLTGLDLKLDELVDKINLQLGQVEGVEDLAEKYKDTVIVRVATCEKHPDADKLSFCRIDDGGVVKDVPRDENGLVEVVCGAPNVREGQFVVWLPPKSTVPSTFSDKAPFVLDSRELRGVLSHGMIASAKELGLGDDHNGIVVIDTVDLPEDYSQELQPGLPFAEVFGLSDKIIELENKMFTHRPDCFGQLGVAREIFAIMQPEPASNEATDIRFKEADWYWQIPQLTDAAGLELEVTHEAGQVVPRFMAVAVKDIDVKPSPLWMQATLVRWGSKPINNVVDLTNYIMLLTAQPTHAYDYDKLGGHKLGVRLAKSGEKLTLLNNKTYELDEQDIVIVDGEGPIGLAGIMGGKDSEVTGSTKNVVFECATFDMYSVRKTSMKYGLFTDALTRFNKGQSPLQNSRAAKRLLDMVDGTQASRVFDLPSSKDWSKNASVHDELQVRPSFINQRLGLDLNGFAIGNLLRRANFATFADNPDVIDEPLHITAPFWRTDIELPEDVVEEVGRLYGFDKLPVELPVRQTKPTPKNADRVVKQKIRESLSRAGANEVLTYSFAHENVLKKAEQDSDQAFRLSNALSPDLQYYRLSVLPSLLDKVHANIKAGHGEFVLYEIGKGHNKKYHADDDEGLPYESEFVDAIYASKKSHGGAAYYYVRRLVQQLGLDLGFSIKLSPADQNLDYPVTAPFDLKRSAVIETAGGVFLGLAGELKQSVIKNFKLPANTAAMTLDFKGIKEAALVEKRLYAPLSRYPSTSQDISLKSDNKLLYKDILQTVYETAAQAAGETEVKVEPISIYQPEDKASKTTTLHLTFTNHGRTLKDEEIAPIMDVVAARAEEDLGAKRI